MLVMESASLLLILLTFLIGSTNSLSYQRHLLRYLLNESRYEASFYPGIENGTVTEVEVYLHFYNIHSINERDMDFTAEIFLQQRWIDHRLNYEGKMNKTRLEKLYLDQTFIEKVWRPNVYFTKEKMASLHNVPQKNEVMYIYPNGTVIYNMRISMKHGCPMGLQLYPFDSQTCNITIESYSHTSDTVQLHWDSLGIVLPTAVSRHFSLVDRPCVSEQQETTQVGNFSSLTILLVFERESAQYVLQLFIPSVFIIILSWISFLIDPQTVQGRLSLGSVCVLTMVTHHAVIQHSLPTVSYMKAIDIWMIVCQFFVVCVLIEFAYVYYVNVFPGQKKLKSVELEKKYGSTNTSGTNHQQEKQQTTSFEYSESFAMSFRSEKDDYEKEQENLVSEPPVDKVDKVNRVDKCSRLAFPIAFLVFIMCYIAVYGTARQGKLKC